MTQTAQDFGTFQLSTEGVPEADRVAFWCEEMSRVMQLEIEAAPDIPFSTNLAVRVLPGLAVISGSYSPFRLARSRKLIADGNDDLILQFGTSGVAWQPKREVALGTHEALLLPNGSVGSFTFLTAASAVALSLPRAALRPLLRDVDGALLRPVSNDNPALRLLKNYLPVLGDDLVLSSPDMRRTVVAHIYDLVALTFGATRDATEIASERSLPATRLRAIKAEISAELDQGEDVSVGTIAARHKVTPRYVQMLFEGDGTTFTRFVLAERLARAHRMLCNPLSPDRNIAAVAYAAGFGDLSYFIRVFRRAYGATPSEIRADRQGLS